MRGYKVFNPDWSCRDFQYEVGKTYTDDRQPICCHRGFHFCKHILYCFSYYTFNAGHKPLLFFDKPTNITLQQWHNSEAYRLLNKIVIAPVKWIHYSDMTDKEKSDHPDADIVGGYLKELDNSNHCVEWWSNLSDEEKEVIKEIPNFDPNKFYKITGIKVD